MVIFSPSHFSFSLSFFSRRGGGGSISVVYARVKARFRVIKIEEFENRNAIIPLLINIYIYFLFRTSIRVDRSIVISTRVRHGSC